MEVFRFYELTARVKCNYPFLSQGKLPNKLTLPLNIYMCVCTGAFGRHCMYKIKKIQQTPVKKSNYDTSCQENWYKILQTLLPRN
jgi:hypothetical protein